MKPQEKNDLMCCPEFNPIPWEDKTFEWNTKRFIKDSVCSVFYMPLNFGAAMKRLDKQVTNSGAEVPDWLCLSEHTSKWKMDLYLAVDKEISGGKNTTLSGTFYSKVYEGSFTDTGKWSKDFVSTLESKGLKAKRMFMWYTTCPKCAKKYGKNYVVILAQI